MLKNGRAFGVALLISIAFLFACSIDELSGEPSVERVSAMEKDVDDWENILSYGIPGMDEVVVRNQVYSDPDGTDDSGDELTMDVYSPPGTRSHDRLPVVVFVMGYADSVFIDWQGTPLKDYPGYYSWGRLIAAAGMIGITYQTTQEDDLYRVIAYLKQHHRALNLDRERIGIWSCSANPPTAIAYLLGEDGDELSFSVFHYPTMTSPDGYLQDEIDDLSANAFGFYVPPPVGEMPENVPLYIGIAGQDFITFAPDSAYHFADLAEKAGASVYLDFYEDGEHGYDEKIPFTERSADMLNASLQFMIDAFVDAE
jgi:hypothetical protein